MADTLIAGTTIVESSTRSNADIPVGGIIEWDNTFASLPEGFLECDGTTVNDPLSVYNGSAMPNLNTNYVSVLGTEFQGGNNPGGSLTGFDLNTGSFNAAGNVGAMGHIQIPNGAVVTGAILYGNDTAETWTLKRITLSDLTQIVLGTAVINTEDTTISNATIDNSLYTYFFQTSTLDAADTISGGRVTFTPRFKFIIRIR